MIKKILSQLKIQSKSYPSHLELSILKSIILTTASNKNIILNEGDRVTVSWKVEGENVSVKLSLNNGEVKQTGTTGKIPVNYPFDSPVVLTVTDKFGKRDAQQKGFSISVKPKPTPTPNLVTPVPLPTQNIFKRMPLR